jgi:hypothetical protein
VIDVGAVIVTRGDVNIDRSVAPLLERMSVEVWNNQTAAEDMSVFGRYAAIWATSSPVILVQDDDVALSDEAIVGLVKAYVPGRIVTNMPREYRDRYTQHCLVGFGAIFDRDLPEKAFARFRERHPLTEEGFFRRCCDVAFTALTPFTPVDLPFEYLPHTRAENRMYRQKGHTTERLRMLELARQVR